MSKSRIKQITGYVNSSRPVFSRSLVLKSSVLAIILVIAFGVRLLPIRWGYFLSEFDPHYHYRQTKYIIDNGLYGENGWLNWHDYMSWYPWGNRMSEHTYPGLPLTAAALYFFLNALGVPLVPQPQLDPLLSDPVYVLCVLFPVILGTITCLVMYFLGRDLGGEAVGLFAALFLALDSSYIARTSLGFFDDETVGIFSILLFILFFIRSIDKNKSSKTSLFYAVAAGLSLGYLCASWGASRYPIVMTALYALVLLITRRYSRRLLSSYAITYLMALSISANVPRLGTNFVFEVEILAVYAVLFLLCFAEINSSAKTLRKKLFFLSLLFSLLAFFFIFLWSKGMIGMLGTKFLSVLNPFVRFENPLVESVAEHRPSAWGTFYYNWGVGLFFLPVGLFFATTMATNIGIYMIIYGLTSLYFASSMIRITLLLSPVVSLLWALASVRLMRPFILFLREPPQTRRKMRFRRVLGKETAAGILILMFVLFTLTYVIGTDFVAGPLQRQGPRVYTQAFSPTTIGASGMSIRPPGGAARDWVDTLIWMRENLPPSPERPGEPGTVVASWWDYGYWITTIGNRSTLADNGTWNNTQIEQIGRMFMSNETEAVEILKNYNVTHVVVFTTLNMDASGNWRIGMAGGDEGKWQWMAKIPGLDDKSFGNYTLGTDWVDANGNGGPDQGDSFFSNSKGQNSTLHKLMTYGTEMTVQGFSTIPLEHFEEAHLSQEHGSPRFVPGTQYVALVCVYKVNYPAE